MPSIFDIFGEINLESRAFEGSLRTVAGRLQATDAALDQTIARSNKLGDTSATVARRYERFSEQIQAQRNRLLDNALAFEKGEISAQKFSAVVVSVDRATASLSSKLRDAKARLTELDETGLTNFQQQITGAVRNANAQLESFRQNIIAQQQAAAAPQSTSLWKSLSGQQKTQLSFQLNDVVSGLAMGQSPFQILAQQGGQIVQIFQQGKVAQEGIATAASTAATAQAAFAASSAASVAPQAAVATSAAATAASTQAAAAAMTVMGLPLVAVGAVIATVLVDLLAIYRATRDIEEAAKLRLKIEEEITGELNKQRLAIVAFEKERREAQAGREFDRALGSAGSDWLTRERASKQAELNRLQQEIDRETTLRGAVLSTVPIKDEKKRDQFLTGGLGEQKERVEQLREEILKLDETLDKTASKITTTVTGYSGIIDVAMAHAAAVRKGVEDRAAEAAREADKKRKEMAQKAIDDAKKWADHVKGAAAEVFNIFSNYSDNPFVKIFNEGEVAVQKMRQATAGLGSDLQNMLEGMIRTQTAAKSFGQELNNKIQASNLLREAAQFRSGGTLKEESVSQRLQRLLGSIGVNTNGTARTGAEWLGMDDPSLGGGRFASMDRSVAADIFYKSRNPAWWNVAGYDRDPYAVDIGGTGGGVPFRFVNAVNANATKVALTPETQRELDQKIIALTQGADAKLLTAGQNQAAADARIREAGRLGKEKDEEKEARTKLNEILTALEGTIKVGPRVDVKIDNRVPDQASTSVDNRYPNQNPR